MNETTLKTLLKNNVVYGKMYFDIWAKFKEEEFTKEDLKLINYNTNEKQVGFDFDKLVYYGFVEISSTSDNVAKYRLQKLKNGIASPHKPNTEKLEKLLDEWAEVSLEYFVSTYENFDNFIRLIPDDVYAEMKEISKLTDYDMYVVCSRG